MLVYFILWKCIVKVDIVYIIVIYVIWCLLIGCECYKEVFGVCKLSFLFGLVYEDDFDVKNEYG